MPRSLRSRSVIIRFSARNFGSVASAAPQRLVLLGRAAARGGALDRLGLDDPGAVLLAGDQRVALRRRAQQPAARALDVVLQEAGVRRGVELAQPEVRRDRVEVALRVEPVGEVDLVAVARVQVPPGPRRTPRRRPVGAVGRTVRTSEVEPALRAPAATGRARRTGCGSASSTPRPVRRPRRRPARAGPGGSRSRSSRTTGPATTRPRARPRAPRTRRRRRPRPRRRSAGSPGRWRPSR